MNGKLDRVLEPLYCNWYVRWVEAGKKVTQSLAVHIIISYPVLRIRYIRHEQYTNDPKKK